MRPDLRLVRTDIAGFFGIAERGPVVPVTDDPGVKVQAAVKLNSWNDFRLYFGGFLRDSYLAYGVRGFFATGGKTCYVVRVGAAASPPAVASIPLPAALTSSRVAALAADIEAGRQSQISLDSPVALLVGQQIAIGPQASGERLSVSSIVDAQTIVVQPGPLTAHSAGDLVYLLSGTHCRSADHLRCRRGCGRCNADHARFVRRGRGRRPDRARRSGHRRVRFGSRVSLTIKPSR